MIDIEEKKKEISRHIEAGNLACDVSDYMFAYNNYTLALEDAKLLSEAIVDKEENDKYITLVATLTKKVEFCHKSLNLKPGDEDKLIKRKPSKSLDKFIGEEKLKVYLKNTLIPYWKEHNLSKRERTCIMIYGPEGASKTIFVQSLINELGATGYFIDPIVNYSAYSDNTKEHFKDLFEKANAKDNVVFYFTKPNAFFPKETGDENKRTFKMFYKLLKKELKIIKKKNLNILFIGSTSAPDKMNEKIFVKGMFDDLLRVHHPDRYARRGLMEERLQGVIFEDSEAMNKLVKRTHGFISKEISNLCRRIKKTAVLYAKDGVNATITNEMLDRVLADLNPIDDLYFKESVIAFEKNLPEGFKVINDNHD